MTRRLRVLYAIKAMIQEALPGIDVLGLENKGVAPTRIPPNGRVTIRAGDPGEPQMDLCPPTYNYEHQIPIEIDAPQTGDRSKSPEQVVDAIVEKIALAIRLDRTCAGKVDYLDGYAPATDDIFTPGAEPARTADLVLIATYSTTDPL